MAAPIQERQQAEIHAKREAERQETLQAEQAIPSGKNVSAETSMSAWRQLAPAVTARTGVTRWTGEYCDYGMAVDALLSRESSEVTVARRISTD